MKQEKLKLNLCVLALDEGGDVVLEKYEEMDKDYKEVWDVSFQDGEVAEVSLEKGLEELDKYFEYDERDEHEISEYEGWRDDFVNLVDGKEGKFYLWGVEYDYNLMFIEE